jgi:hypothetical protein
MRIEKFGNWLAFDTEDVQYSDMMTLGKPGDYTYRCKPELVREYYGHLYEKQRRVSVGVGYCFGKTLAELEQNCIKAIEKAWLRHHQPCTARTYADVMWM